MLKAATVSSRQREAAENFMLQREDSSFSVGAVGLWIGPSAPQWLGLPFIEITHRGGAVGVRLAQGRHPGGILLTECRSRMLKCAEQVVKQRDISRK